MIGIELQLRLLMEKMAKMGPHFREGLEAQRKKEAERMSDKEVLTKAILIAIDNGFLPAKAQGTDKFISRSVYGNPPYICTDSMYEDKDGRKIPAKGKHHINIFLFSHDFVKAFFKDKEPEKLIGQIYKRSYYHDFEIHLMQMVICENPIDYLRKFV